MRAALACAAATSTRGFAPNPRRGGFRSGTTAGRPTSSCRAARAPTIKTHASAPTSDPLSSKERAEFDLLRRAESLDGGRRGEASSSTAASDHLTPAESRVAQLSPEFAEQQKLMRFAKNFAPKKYANVLSEFEGEVDVEASLETCYALWNDASALKRFVPGLEVATAVGFTSDATRQIQTAECELFYQFGSSKTHELEALRFMVTAVERDVNKSVHWQSTDGFPCGAVVSFSENGNKTTCRLEFYCHLPYDLAVKEGAMKVSLDVEERLAECLTGFAVVAQGVDTAGGVSKWRSGASENDKIFLAPDVVPRGLGLDAFLEPNAEVSATAMEAAAERVRQRVKRRPFTAEVLKEMGKGK